VLKHAVFCAVAATHVGDVDDEEDDGEDDDDGNADDDGPLSATRVHPRTVAAVARRRLSISRGQNLSALGEVPFNLD
jgi:hypothetical protein